MSDIPDILPPAPATNEERVMAEMFTLQVVSPSVGVNGPLIFSDLPVETTVKELKAKIRAALSMQPADESQRLIHRGRLLSKETDTMSEVFGKDTLKNSESHTLHLVLRPPTSNSPALPGTPNPAAQLEVQSAGPGIGLRGNGTPAPNSNRPEHVLPDLQNNVLPDNAAQNQQQVHQRLQATLQAVHHHHALQAQHHAALQNMNNHLNRLQREAERIHRDLDVVERHHMQHHHHHHHQNAIPGGIQPTAIPQTGALPNQVMPVTPGSHTPVGVGAFQNVRGQYHRDRIAMGTHGAQINGNPAVAGLNTLPHNLATAGHHPERTSTFTREGTGPNGERWQVTVNETTTVIPTTDFLQNRSGPLALPPRDVQHVLGHLDFLQRGALQPLPARDGQDVTESRAPAAQQGTDVLAASSGSAPSVPDLNVPGPATTVIPADGPSANSQPSSATPQVAESATTTPPNLNSPMVYILSSPTGPRALLVNGSQMFFTPRRTIEADAAQQAQINAALGAANSLPQARNRRDGRLARAQPRQAHAEGVPAHPANPNAAAAAVQAWPHLWLAIRLLGFIWFFTSGNSSWTRCILVSGLAFAFFLMQAGLLNGVAETFYGPLRRHLEALLPLAGPQHLAANPAPPGQHPPAAQQAVNPESTAQRLIAQRRRANGSWLWLQLRRVEHATILFLASLIPGVGERHIAARAAEATEAERQREQAATAAAAAAAATAAPPAVEGQDERQRDTESTAGSGLPVDGAESGSPADGADAQSDGAAEAPAPAPPLVEI